ncbi:MAG: serine/threonine-protein kinase [Candidatus Limnocylindrales bacterium]
MTTTEIQPGAKLDQFTIVKAIGHGAYSDVYLAEDPGGRRVVLKCPHESIMGDVATFDRFRRELEISRRLSHPGIQRPIEFTSDRSRPYMVMEYVDGETLRAVLSREKRLSVDKAVDYGCQLAAAMAYAHSQGVIHRDLKPENVLVTPDGRLVVTDFGVALMAGARRLTWRWFSTALGTPDYMSPEQIQGKRGDARTDVYAIGVIIFEMLAGRVPWEGDNALSVMSQAINSPAPPYTSSIRRSRRPSTGSSANACARPPTSATKTPDLSSRIFITGGICRSRSSYSATSRSSRHGRATFAWYS